MALNRARKRQSEALLFARRLPLSMLRMKG
jgi:hypothetical protein